MTEIKRKPLPDPKSAPKHQYEHDPQHSQDRANNPHDTLFKAIFSVPEYFAAFLRERLPPKVVACLTAGPPELLDKSFITAQREVHCDLLYRLPLNTARGRGKSGGKAKGDCLFVPLEHKSTPDSKVHLQMLGYQLLIWEQQASKGKAGRLELPPIIPLVVYNGRKPWHIPPRFPQQFKDCGAVGDMAREMADCSHLLTNLRRTPVDSLTRHPELWALLAILRGDPGGSKAEWRALLTRIANSMPLRDEPRIQRAVTEAILYVATNWSDNADYFLVQQLPTRGGEGERLVGTYTEQCMTQGKAESLIAIMQHRFGDLTEGNKAQVTQASPDDIEVWTLRALDAPSVDAVFNGDGKPRHH